MNKGVLFEPTVLFAITLMAIIVMMVLPVPSFVLDIGLAASFALAIVVFTTTLFVQRPLDFSAFPTLLLASLMLRLSLNISSTKLIISDGHTGTAAAGNVIEAFANFIMGGSLLMGLVVFLVLLIVNFMVITKGATRMAEVGARFALDGMPGKQLAIDSDVSSGAISHEEAKSRREIEQAETTFFGSLDGASKYVKGDAIAGLLITLLNLIVGILVGTILHAMPLADAFSTYAILTIGDGLVTQIPAVIISIASALLLSRGASKVPVDVAIFSQLSKHPKSLATVSAVLFGFAILPGLPVLPFMMGSAAIGIWAYQSSKTDDRLSTEDDHLDDSGTLPIRMGDLLDFDDIHLEFSPNLIPMVLDPTTGMDVRIKNMRQHIAKSFGIILSEIRLTDNAELLDNEYAIRIQGVEIQRHTIHPERLLALIPDSIDLAVTGIDVTEPVYGAPARWISKDDQNDAALMGATTVTPPEVIATHLFETIKRSFSRLFTLKTMNRLMEELANLTDTSRAAANRKLFDDLIPERVTSEQLHSILKALLDDRISIRNLPLILEAISEIKERNLPAQAVYEHVRQRLGFQITHDLSDQNGCIELLNISSRWEEVFNEHEYKSETGETEVALSPEKFSSFIEAAETALAKTNEKLSVIVSSRRRRFISNLFKAKGMLTPVISYEELGIHARPLVVGSIE